jgi:hypothetical protein
MYSIKGQSTLIFNKEPLKPEGHRLHCYVRFSRYEKEGLIKQDLQICSTCRVGKWGLSTNSKEQKYVSKEKSHKETPCKNVLLSKKQGQYIFEVGAECL